MLEKILRIAGLARFVDYSASGSVDFKKVTLIWAENGRGKSSIAQLIRSLSTRCPDFIEERRRHSSGDGIRVSLRVDGENAEYRGGVWTGPQPQSYVFDVQFVQENVYCGSEVNVDNRRALYVLIIGGLGKKLVSKIEMIDDGIKKLSEKIRATGSEISQHLQSQIGAPAFCEFAVDENAAAKLDQEQKRWLAMKKVEEIRQKEDLSEIREPMIPLERLRSILAFSKDDVDAGFERTVHTMANAFLGGNGENWLGTGVQVVKNDKCPFCGQDIAKNKVLQAYRHYFSDVYTTTLEGIRNTRDAASSDLEKALSQVPLVLQHNSSSIEWWSNHFEIKAILVEPEELPKALGDVLQSFQHALDAKERNPYGKIDSAVEESFQEALRELSGIVLQIRRYNAAINDTNKEIEIFKESLDSTSAAELSARVKHLEDLAYRSSDAGAKLAGEYENLTAAKAIADRNKSIAKTDLDTYNTNLPPAFMESVNRYLEHFGAEYSIVSPAVSFVGRLPNAKYCLQIDGSSIDLGAVGQGTGTPRFASALSEGDKNALALAIFCTTLDLDASLADKILVFDDPISSLDDHRRSATGDAISAYFHKAQQIVVLSHDPHFLRDIRQKIHPADSCQELSIARTDTGSTIQPWDSDIATREEYYRDYETLTRFLGNGGNDPDTLCAVQRSIRQCLEGNLRQTFPAQFGAREWLGDYIAKIRAAGPQDPLYKLNASLQDLTDMNEYCGPAHHSEEGRLPQRLSEIELRTFVKRAINFIQR